MTTTTISTANKRYVHLDGLRGILAIAVVIHHFAFAMQLHWFNKAWISVDAFFVLSGFVIAHSYQNKITQGLGLREFAFARVGRLYPVYFVGLGLGVLALTNSSFNPMPDATAQGIAVALGLLVLPYLNTEVWPVIAGTSQGGVFPLNEPAWSLFFELFVNLIFFVWLKYGRKLGPWLITTIFFVVHLTVAQHNGLHSGWGESNFAGGFFRVTLFFFMGVAIYSIHTRLTTRSTWFFALGTAAMLGGFMLKNTAVDYLLLFVVAPLTILVGSRIRETTGRWSGVMNWLGGISYPIYITHYPLGIMLRTTVLSDISAAQFVLISTPVSIILADLIARAEKLLRGHWQRRALARSTLTS